MLKNLRQYKSEMQSICFILVECSRREPESKHPGAAFSFPAQPNGYNWLIISDMFWNCR